MAGKIRYPVVLFVVLLVLLISLRPLSRSWNREDRGLRAVRYAVRRSLATALLAVLLTTRFLYPLAPGVIFDLSLLIALFPVQRLVPGVVWPQLRAPLYGLIGLLFIQQIQEIAGVARVEGEIAWTYENPDRKFPFLNI